MTQARGARAALDMMNQMGGIPMISKNFASGDKVVLAFHIEGVDDSGAPIITVAKKLGNSVNLGDDSTFKRSFLPTMSTLNERNEVIVPDFAETVAPIFSALISADKEKRTLEIKNNKDMNDKAKQIELNELEEDFKKKFPAVSRLGLRVYSEVCMFKIDQDNKIIGNASEPFYGGIQISKKKLIRLIELSETAGAYKEGANYFYIIMQLATTTDRTQLTQVDWNTPTKPEERLEVVNPTFDNAITKTFTSRRPTAETIEAKVYDFKPYDEGQFREAVKVYIDDRSYKLTDPNTKKPYESVLKKSNVTALKELGLMATAETIQALIDANNPSAPAQVSEQKQDATASFNEKFNSQGGVTVGQGQQLNLTEEELNQAQQLNRATDNQLQGTPQDPNGSMSL